MNTATAILLFLLGSFALIIGFISVPSIQYYTGGVIIALFIAGLLYAWGNTIRQTRNVVEQKPEEPKPASNAPSA
ncbi:MAG: hypothetical protein OK439_05925 [Thaumarchaeota archaeon]|nr:hypothetical protein [Nitrososphaerota archaeon]